MGKDAEKLRSAGSRKSTRGEARGGRTRAVRCCRWLPTSRTSGVAEQCQRLRGDEGGQELEPVN